MSIVLGPVRWPRVAAVLALAALVAGCAREALLTPLNWAAPSAHLASYRAIAYGPDARQTLDLYVADLAQPAPVMIFWHGGSWQNGDKDYYRFVGAALAARGFLAVVPNYRLAPRCPFPCFIQDAALAVKWVRDHAGAYGGDVRRLYLSGHSAGGHIALLLGLQPGYLSGVGLARADLAGIVALAAPTGLEDLRGGAVAGVFPPSVPDEAFSPITLALAEAAGAPPMLLLSGAADTVIAPANTRKLAAALRAGGGQVSLEEYPDTGHLGLLLQFSELFGGAGGAPDAAARFAGRLR